MADRALTFDLLGKDRASAAFKAVGDSAEGFGKRAKGAFSSAGDSAGKLTGTIKTLAGVAAGAFAGAKLVDFLKESVTEGRESNRVAAQTAAVIKSTGGAAKLTAKQFSDLATAISMKTGIDDEQIQSAENLLATFTNVRNEAGKGNDIFSQSTSILVDMSKALGEDTSSAAIQLGKALNDPIKGVTALRRVGVSFTADQLKQIKVFQESGDLMGAQKLILGELGKEFGGSAAAQATAADKLKVIYKNVQEQIGQALIPVIDRLATWLSSRLPAALTVAGRVFGKLEAIAKPIIRTVVVGMSALVASFKDPDVTSDGFVGVMERIGAAFRRAWDAVGSFLYTLKSGFTRQDVATGPERLAMFVRNTLLPAFEKVTSFIKDHLKPILVVLGVAFAAATAPLTSIAAALVYAYLHFDRFRGLVDTVAGFIVRKAVPAVRQFAGHIVALAREGVDAALPKLRLLANIIETKILPAIGKAAIFLRDHLVAGFRLVAEHLEKNRPQIEKFVAILAVVAGFIAGKIVPIVLRLAGVLAGELSKTIGGAIDMFGAFWRAVSDVIDFAGRMGAAFANGFDAIKAGATDAARWLVDHLLNPTIDGINLLIKGINLVKPGSDIKLIGHVALPDDSAAAPSPVGEGRRGALAMGGPAFPFRQYVVGENGPEVLRMGAQGGYVTPNHALGGALGGVHVEHYEQHLHGPVDGEETKRDTVRAFRQLAWLG